MKNDKKFKDQLKKILKEFFPNAHFIVGLNMLRITGDESDEELDIILKNISSFEDLQLVGISIDPIERIQYVTPR